MKTKDSIILRKVHGSFFLVDIKQNYLNDKCTLYELNETGAFIWEKLKIGCDLDDIYSTLISGIVSDRDIKYEILHDIKEYIALLFENGFLEE